MFVSVYLVLSFLLSEWFFLLFVLFVICVKEQMSPLFIKCYLTWPDLREFESASSQEDEKAPMAAKRHAPSHFDQHVRLPAWGFLLVFYSSHSPKICRFESRAWDRQRHGRTDGWTGWWMCRQTTVYLRDNGYVSTNIHKLNWWSTCRQQNSPSVIAHLPRRNVNNPCCPIARLWLCE